MTSGLGSRGQSLGHSACGWHPVGCRLAKGNSLFPTQSWQDSGFILLQPQPAKSLFPWSLGPLASPLGTSLRERRGRRGRAGTQAGILWPASLLGGPVVCTSGSLWPRQPQHVTGGRAGSWPNSNSQLRPSEAPSQGPKKWGQEENTRTQDSAAWQRGRGATLGGGRGRESRSTQGGSSVMGLLEEVGQEWEEKLEEKRGSDCPEEYPESWVAPFCLS